MAANNNAEARQAIKGGVTGGAIGGAVLAIILMTMQAVRGDDIWPALKFAAYPFIGETATEPGFAFGPILLGVTVHFAVSLTWGALFGLLFYGVSRPGTVLYGALWGMFVWVAMYFVVLQIAGMGDTVRGAPMGFAALTHLLFGVSVGLGFLPFQRPGHGPIPRRATAVPT